MRFALVVDRFEEVYGGIEYQGQQLAAGLRSLGHDVLIDPPRFASNPTRAPVDWVIFEGIRRTTLFRFLASRQGGPKSWLIPHGSFYSGLHKAELKALGYRQPEPASSMRLWYDQLFMKQICREVDVIGTLSATESADLTGLFGVDSAKLRVLPQLIGDLEDSTSPSDRFAGRLSQPYFLTVSRIERRKNVVGAVRAAILANARLLVAGSDGGQLSELRRVAAQAPDLVEYLGVVTEGEKNHLIRGAAALVIPSFFEGLPVIMLEALRLGTPVICTRLSYAPVMRGVLLCDPSPREIASKMIATLEHRDSVDGTIVANRSKVLERYVQILSEFSKI